MDLIRCHAWQLRLLHVELAQFCKGTVEPRSCSCFRSSVLRMKVMTVHPFISVVRLCFGVWVLPQSMA